MGIPVQENIGQFTQAISYFLSFTILLLSLKYRIFRLPLAAIYGVLAMLSFSGIQTWIYYSGDNNILGPGMAAWDLAIAIALLLDDNS
jgi:hypothetical protein